MTTIAGLFILVVAVGAAILVGNSFLEKAKNGRNNSAPWYQPYLSMPGLIVVVAILLPILVWWLSRR